MMCFVMISIVLVRNISVMVCNISVMLECCCICGNVKIFSVNDMLSVIRSVSNMLMFKLVFLLR